MWIIFFALFLRGSLSAMTNAEVKEDFTKIILLCLNNNPVNVGDLLKLRAYETPDKYEAKCLLACGFRKMGVLKENGMFELQKCYNYADRTKVGNKKEIANGKLLADTCVKVNDEAVGDGEKGCERASLMFKCLLVNAPKFGFIM